MNVATELEADINILELGELHPDVNLNFDINFKCLGDGGLEIITGNYSVDAEPSVVEYIKTLGLAWYLESQLESG